ncbi:hypothetical protein HMPREF9372_0907 [Sporosarcina newyorkensis 2681]|uniref:Uncharacterized protein n=1 Tax=Sporosarcina newyorkensis 2681 TaxID=1027292 RepID=F9DQ27_9BACL|nr:hypothetical protein HMPREF9372_0907 [Sporosarcina newyorkensis 2681]
MNIVEKPEDPGKVQLTQCRNCTFLYYTIRGQKGFCFYVQLPSELIQ